MRWTSVIQARGVDGGADVTVAAETSSGFRYLSVPVRRDDRGFLTIAGYPAFVGPPATNSELETDDEAEVEDPELIAVVTRALSNYLAAERRNLLADLTADAVVSLPPEPLRMLADESVTWVERGERVAVEAVAREAGSEWTLRYELEVINADRWYVNAIAVDPTFQGGM